MQKTKRAHQTKCSVVMQLLSASGTSEYHRAVTGTHAADLPLSERKTTVIGIGRSVPGLHFGFAQPCKADVTVRCARHNTDELFVHRTGECPKHVCSLLCNSSTSPRYAVGHA